MSTESLTTVEMNTSPSSSRFFFVRAAVAVVVVVETHSTCTAFFVLLFIVDIVVFHALLNTKWIFPFTFGFFSLFSILSSAAPLIRMMYMCWRLWAVCVCARELSVLSCLHNRAIIFRVKVSVWLGVFVPCAGQRHRVSYIRWTTGTSFQRAFWRFATAQA